MVHLKVRVFTFSSSPREQNSYVVGTWEGGLLPTVGTLKLDDYSESASVTFAQLRPRIELQNDNFMIRRSLLFQEVLAIIATSPNPHQWPHSALQTYWFGFYEDLEQRVPTILPVADEDSPVSAFLNMTTSRQTGDLILIPQTQVGPVCEKCCEGCALCPPVRKQATRVQSKN
ncbi:hypothetical protein Gpo141_00012674 [Globisporangium polare]